MSGGYSASIVLDPSSLGSMGQYAAVSLDTETLLLPQEEAEKKLRGVAQALLPWKDSAVFFKRIEPALRGNAGMEIRVLARALKFEYIVVTPALSRGRRAIEEGTSYLEAQEQDAASLRAATIESTTEVLRAGEMEPIPVSLEDVRNGKVSDIVSAKGCFCFDVETDEDLKAIVQGVLEATPAKNVLWVGAMGLAEALAMTPQPFVVVIGTTHPRSILQARQILGLAMAYPVQIDAGALKDGSEAAAAERARTADEAESLLRRRYSVLLAPSLNGRFVRGIYPGGGKDELLDHVAETVREIIGRVKIGGLCVTGGDCAVRIVKKAKAESVALVAEVQEGIAFSRLKGGSFDGLPFITKSGALGGERALIHCVEYLRQHLGNQGTL
jgi:uncharacterized protein YgbK (DUF1537 family)